LPTARNIGHPYSGKAETFARAVQGWNEVRGTEWRARRANERERGTVGEARGEERVAGIREAEAGEGTREKEVRTTGEDVVQAEGAVEREGDGGSDRAEVAEVAEVVEVSEGGAKEGGEVSGGGQADVETRVETGEGIAVEESAGVIRLGPVWDSTDPTKKLGESGGTVEREKVTEAGKDKEKGKEASRGRVGLRKQAEVVLERPKPRRMRAKTPEFMRRRRAAQEQREKVRS
jgi:hypothetical protein